MIPLTLGDVVRDTIMNLQPTAKRKRIRLVERDVQPTPARRRRPRPHHAGRREPHRQRHTLQPRADGRALSRPSWSRTRFA